MLYSQGPNWQSVLLEVTLSVLIDGLFTLYLHIWPRYLVGCRWLLVLVLELRRLVS
jgi:hypothetical protein